ncbi:MAG TPA: pantoate--beta-alanine ligase [Clostridia bacterium]|nr:pantoate--beta-alanine ligase [Clostridia bacterium]
MDVIYTKKDIRKKCEEIRCTGRLIGFVPTMGFFHEGHLSLMRRSKAENDVTVVSIFVNPLQFGPAEDFKDYPRDLASDLNMAGSLGVDMVFCPDVNEMYPEGFRTIVVVRDLSDVLCGASRPGHFQGVATVVSKLFNLIRPHRAYFGQKDAQQVVVIKRMVEDLEMDIEVVEMPTVREADGLAMSSRNVYLTPSQRQQATIIWRALQEAERRVAQGERDAESLRKLVRETIETAPEARIDYVSVCDAQDLQELKRLEGEVLIAVAVRFGRARLIDNVKVRV